MYNGILFTLKREGDSDLIAWMRHYAKRSKPVTKEQILYYSAYRMPLEESMALHSSTLAWEIPWTEEPGRLQSMGSLRVEHDWARLSDFPFTFHFHALEKEMATHSSVLARDGGSWWAAVYGVAQSWTQLKWLSSSRGVKLIECRMWLSGSGERGMENYHLIKFKFIL